MSLGGIWGAHWQIAPHGSVPASIVPRPEIQIGTTGREGNNCRNRMLSELSASRPGPQKPRLGGMLPKHRSSRAGKRRPDDSVRSALREDENVRRIDFLEPSCAARVKGGVASSHRPWE